MDSTGSNEDVDRTPPQGAARYPHDGRAVLDPELPAPFKIVEAPAGTVVTVDPHRLLEPFTLTVPAGSWLITVTPWWERTPPAEPDWPGADHEPDRSYHLDISVLYPNHTTHQRRFFIPGQAPPGTSITAVKAGVLECLARTHQLTKDQP